MIKIETIFTEADAARLLSVRGINIQEREVVWMDGDREWKFPQLQAQNPFSGEWETVETAFRRIAEKAGEEQITERILGINLAECF